MRLRDALSYFASATPARFAVAIFVGLIVVFTILLSLPALAADGQPTNFADALFTATSAICVTGLATVDMATHWSGLGHVIIVIATQLGAVGVLTLASLMGLVVSRRLGLRQRLLAAGDVNPMALSKGGASDSPASRLGEVGGLLATVAASTLSSRSESRSSSSPASCSKADRFRGGLRVVLLLGHGLHQHRLRVRGVGPHPVSRPTSGS